MKKIKYFSRLIALFIVLSQFSGCGVMGEQAAKWESGMFSPDGKYYVYTYSNMFITQYSKKGGSTTRIGSITYYIQTIDCITGKKLLEKPLESKEQIKISNIIGDYAMFSSYDMDKRFSTPSIFDLKSKKMKFATDDIRKINPSIPLTNVTQFFDNVSGTKEFIVEGDDGRKYAINPTSGKASIAIDEFTRLKNKFLSFYQEARSVKGYFLLGDTRKKIGKGKNWKNPEILSDEDFISPKYLMIDKTNRTAEDKITIYDNHFFVLSNVSTNGDKEMQVSMIDDNTLKTKWSFILPQGHQEMNNYNKERFYLKDNQLFVANSTYLMNIDLDKGKIVKQTELFKIINKEE